MEVFSAERTFRNYRLALRRRRVDTTKARIKIKGPLFIETKFFFEVRVKSVFYFILWSILKKARNLIPLGPIMLIGLNN